MGALGQGQLSGIKDREAETWHRNLPQGQKEVYHNTAQGEAGRKKQAVERLLKGFQAWLERFLRDRSHPLLRSIYTK